MTCGWLHVSVCLYWYLNDMLAHANSHWHSYQHFVTPTDACLLLPALLYPLEIQWFWLVFRNKTLHTLRFTVRNGIHVPCFFKVFLSDSCPAPSEASFTSGIGYGCHRGAQNCLNGNTPIDSLQEAWNRCGEVSGCTRIMKFTDNKFYLKEANDPVVSSAGSNSGTSGIEFYNTCASKPLSFTKIAQVILTKK